MMISIIIPWRDSGQLDRRAIFNWCIPRYKALFPNAEIVLCDSGDTIFSRGKSINKGVAESNGDYLIITDADYLFSDIMARDIVNKQPWTVACKQENYYFLNEEVTSLVLNTSVCVDLKAFDFAGCSKQSPYPTYGQLMAMPKWCFDKVKFDPSFKGYGYEDEAFFLGCKAVLGKEYRTNNKMYHMHHNRIMAQDYMKMSGVNKHFFVSTYEPIRHSNKELRKYVNKYNSEG